MTATPDAPAPRQVELSADEIEARLAQVGALYQLMVSLGTVTRAGDAAPAQRIEAITAGKDA
ncbi:MAG: hypothetical protein IPL61_25220 [Myxococcales bacterium]|nr:hypothetical protein [Myxococcales bacterium]